MATSAGVSLHLHFDGYSDASGSDELNAQLRMERADWLRNSLREAGVAVNLFKGATLFTATDPAAEIRGAKLRVQVVETSR